VNGDSLPLEAWASDRLALASTSRSTSSTGRLARGHLIVSVDAASQGHPHWRHEGDAEGSQQQVSSDTNLCRPTQAAC
jgi:hypothetical protein